MELFKVLELSPRIVRISGQMTEHIYLVRGDERAALIDSGGGFGSLRGVVERFTDKPVLVLLTHGHVDHAMGAGEFGDVWMDPRDLPVFRKHAAPEFRRGALRAVRPGFSDELPMLPAPDPGCFHPLADGDSFDLGGLHLDIFGCPGHTPGSMVVLVRELRTLAVGDACSNFTFLGGPESLSVPEYMQALSRLRARLTGRFDAVLDAHGTGELPADIMDGVLEACDDILSGRADDVPCAFAGHSGVLAKARQPHSRLRADGKSGNIFYKKQQ